MTTSPRCCSADSTSTASFSSTTMRARAGLSRCGSWPPASWWCWGWSPPSAPSSSQRTSSSGGSRRPHGTSPSSGSACRPSAASPPRSRATPSPTTTRCESWPWWSKPPPRSGADAGMQAAVTEGVGAVAVVERDEPGAPGAGQVLVTPEAVGICGSDYHYFAGELSEAAGGSQFPRVQGHEVGATVVAVGPGARSELRAGQRVALWPLQACGSCYPCSVGRGNTCDNFELIGIHVDGGLQEQLIVPDAQVYPIEVDDPALA